MHAPERGALGVVTSEHLKMSDLNSYFARYFLEGKEFAALCGLTEEELRALVLDRLIPAPSYVVSQSCVTSHVFGRMQAPAALDGDYFHPGSSAWVTVARSAIGEVGRKRAYEVLRRRFAENLKCALRDLNGSTLRLRDSFADDGSEIAEGLLARVESIWEHFLRGTFGLCVADPSSEAAIAWKEVLQEKLTLLSENGAKNEFSQAEAQTVRELIDAYAQAAMPFSPIEYAVSSRKRLVEDLSARIAAQQTLARDVRNARA